MSNPAGLALARERIAEEQRAHTGFLDLGRLGLTAPPEELFELHHLEGLNLGALWFDELGWHVAIGRLDENHVEGWLAELKRLPGLRMLSLSGLAILDLSSLARLNSLQTLFCSETEVSDLAPLARLNTLQSLDCSGTQVSDLAPLARLNSLQTLDCSGTRVSDLAPLARLNSLQTLNCWNTQVSDLAPLARLNSLQTLDCSGTQVSDLAPLARLNSFQTLDCSETQVSDLAPLARLNSLQTLNCSHTKVSDLASLARLNILQTLFCWDTKIESVPPSVLELPALSRLVVSSQAIREIPPEIVSRDRNDNCLERLRAHFRDLGDDGQPLPDVKVFVLGNGRIGKTQICRRLRGEEYEGDADSTHGILVTSARLPMMDGIGGRQEREALLHLWDFGGQDLYHGTHGLFLRSRSIVLIVWTTRSENETTHEHGGITFRNHQLPYWVETVRHGGGAGQPLILAQNMCERAEDERRQPPVDDEILDAFPACKLVHYSAQLDRGRRALDEAIQQAVDWHWERQGQVRIGKGRLAARRRLEALQQEDAARPAAARRHRTMTRAEFDALCQEVGGISSTDALLDYLDAADVIIHRPGLFQGQIILDHAWALDAVYAVFDRKTCYQNLKAQRGRFTRSLLADLVWRGHDEAEQELFLELMTSCGVAFAHRKGDPDRGLETEYIAPDLLPGRGEIEGELDWMWAEHAPGDTLMTVTMPFLRPGLMRGLISRIGQEAGLSAIYWKDGVCFFEQLTRSRALIEQHPDATPGRWGGRLVVETRGGDARALLARLRRWLEVLLQSEGGTGWTIDPPADAALARREQAVVLGEDRAESPRRGEARLPAADEGGAPLLDLDPRERIIPGAAPVEGRTYGVSYAWDDPSRAIVDRVCATAEAKGIRVLRDTTRLKAGDSFLRFVKELGSGDRRLFVILSDKYLKSEYCMTELLEVWRNCGQERDAFAERIRVFRLEDVAVDQLPDQIRYTKHWWSKEREIKEVCQGDLTLLSVGQYARYDRIRAIAQNIGEMLDLIFDRIFARDFAEFEKHGFDA